MRYRISKDWRLGPGEGEAIEKGWGVAKALRGFQRWGNFNPPTLFLLHFHQLGTRSSSSSYWESSNPSLQMCNK